MPRYRVFGEWIIVADNPHHAEALIENAIAAHIDAELESCDAEPEDEPDED
jgi:hypothetical protein